MNFARLNHVLIPNTLEERERWRSSRMGKVAARFFRIWQSLTARGRSFVLVLLVVGGLSTEASSSQVFVLFSLLLGAFVGAWLARYGFSLPEIRAHVRSPKRISVGEDVRFQIEVMNQGQRDVRALQIRGPYLPWDGKWTGAAPFLEKLSGGERATTKCRARFESRGPHHLDAFTVQALVPLGLTLGPPIQTDPLSFLVVPRIAPVGHLETPVIRRHQPGGVALASHTGESMDLLGIRDYRPGDALRDLHARSWARLGRPVVREYQEEYFTRIGVIVDTDSQASSNRQLEAGLSLSAGIIEHLSRGEALIDLLLVGNQVHTLTLGRSLGFLDQALDLLACVVPSSPFDASENASRLAPHLNRLSCLVFVAMAWNPERQSFVERIQSTGVACRTIVILPPSGKPAFPLKNSTLPQVTQIATESIEGGIPLWL